MQRYLQHSYACVCFFWSHSGSDRMTNLRFWPRSYLDAGLSWVGAPAKRRVVNGARAFRPHRNACPSTICGAGQNNMKAAFRQSAHIMHHSRLLGLSSLSSLSSLLFPPTSSSLSLPAHKTHTTLSTMKLTATTLAVASVIAYAQAQNTTAPAGNGTDYATGLVAALNGAGLTTLAGVLGGYPQIAQMLQMGGNYTVSMTACH